MFQFLRRVSGSLLPRPDRPWREDATSHAPTIGRKRRYSVTEQDTRRSASSAKRAKNELAPDTERDSASEEKDAKRGVAPLVEGQDVKEVTTGVEEVDLEDRDKAEAPSSIRPEGVPLPDSPSESPEPESELPEADVVEEPQAEQRTDDVDSVASSSPQDGVEEAVGGSGRTVAEFDTDTPPDELPPTQDPLITTAALGLYDAPEALEVSA